MRMKKNYYPARVGKRCKIAHHKIGLLELLEFFPPNYLSNQK